MVTAAYILHLSFWAATWIVVAAARKKDQLEVGNREAGVAYTVSPVPRSRKCNATDAFLSRFLRFLLALCDDERYAHPGLIETGISDLGLCLAHQIPDQ